MSVCVSQSFENRIKGRHLQEAFLDSPEISTKCPSSALSRPPALVEVSWLSVQTAVGSNPIFPSP